MPWEDILGDPEFQALGQPEKEQVLSGYFSEHVDRDPEFREAVKADPAVRETVWRNMWGTLRPTKSQEIPSQPTARPQDPGLREPYLQRGDLPMVEGDDTVARGLIHGTMGLAESAGTLLEVGGRKIGDEPLSEVGRTASRFWEEKAKGYEAPPELQGSVVERPELLADASWWAYNVAETVPSFAASILPGAGAARGIQVGGQALKLSPIVIARLAALGGALTGGLAGGSLEGTQTYKEALKKGATPEQAERAGELMTLASGALNAISVGKVLKGPGAGSRLVNWLTSGATEAVTEYLEEPAEIGARAVAGIPQSKDEVYEQLVSGVNVIPPAFILGLFGGAGASLRQVREATPYAAKSPEEQVQEVLERGEEEAAARGTTPLVEEQTTIEAEGEAAKQEFLEQERAKAAEAAQQEAEVETEPPPPPPAPVERRKTPPEGPRERRKDLALRKKIEDMTPEERASALMYDELTGLKSRRAFDEEADLKPVKVALDVHGLKWINDNVGHDAGDQLLRAVADAIHDSGEEGYRMGGSSDELVIMGDTPEGAAESVERIKRVLADSILEATLPDGRKTYYRGITLSHGTGGSIDEAFEALNIDKQAAIERGERSAERGGRPGKLAEIPAEGEQAAGAPEVEEAEEVVAPATELHPEPHELTPEPISPPGDRWTLDPGSIPGEPSMFLDGDAESSTAVLIEVEKGEGAIWEAQGADGKTIGQFTELADAAKAAEEWADRAAAEEAEPPPAEEPKPPPPEVEETFGKVEGGRVTIEPAWLAIALNRHFFDKGLPLPKDRIAMRKWVASKLGITSADLQTHLNQQTADWKDVEEGVEYAIVRRAREIYNERSLSVAQKYEAIKELYESQPALSQRTSESIGLQQYSTPAPLAFLMGRWLQIHKAQKVYEPTAGTGMLLIGAKLRNVVANELDQRRGSILEHQGFETYYLDATETRRPIEDGTADVVVANPPFGSLKKTVEVEGYRLTQIDHVIAARSLDAMKDDGRAALIIGDHNLDENGRITGPEQTFLNYLYSHYNVRANIEINGDVYRKQGTSWPIRLILISGRNPAPDTEAIVTPAELHATKAETFDDVRRIVEEVGYGKPATAPRGEGGTVPTAEGPRGEPAVRPGAGERGGRPVRSGERQPRDDRGGPAADGGEVAGRPVGAEEVGAEIVPGAEAGVEPARDRGAAEPELLKKPAPPIEVEEAVSHQVTYRPKSKAPAGDNKIPEKMAGPVAEALDALEARVGDVDAYVGGKLQYDAQGLQDAFSAEQVDALALAIDQIDRGTALINGDQTGVGKGRVAAGVIRYANLQGKVPVFVTAMPKLFTDMWRDLTDIGHRTKPFLMHGDKDKASIYDDTGKVLFQPHGGAKTYQEILGHPGGVAAWMKAKGFGLVMAPYSQVQSAQSHRQRSLLERLAPDNIVILDESHKASGDSRTGTFFREQVVRPAAGAIYLSATYAKRPDTMPLYFRTNIGATGMPVGQIIGAVTRGGVALQQWMANALARSGQYIRRELDFGGISFRQEIDEGNRERDSARSDRITSILREVLRFDAEKLAWVATLDDAKKEQEKQALGLRGTIDTGKQSLTSGVTSVNFAAVVHNVVGQMLLGVKAQSAADAAVAALRAGQKPVINLMNTMESFLEDVVAFGNIREGEPIGFSFQAVLQRALRSTLRVTETDARGKKTTRYLTPEQLPAPVQILYRAIEGKIAKMTDLDVPGSPIDFIMDRIRREGFKVTEITGRTLRIDYSEEIPVFRKRPAKEVSDRNLPIIRFQSGEVDALVINAAGSTGLSAHADARAKDQRPRVMIVLQPDLNIDTFTQALGRVNRKGQVVKPNYKLLQTAIPAEIRPGIVLRKKMSSLNANTSANTESATSIDMPDMLNSFGDEVTLDFLMDNPRVNLAIGDPLELGGGRPRDVTDVFRKISGRIALAPVRIQEEFYSAVTEAYLDRIAYLDAMGENTLRQKDYDFRAVPKRRVQLFRGVDERNPLTSSALAEEMSVRVLKRPFPKLKLQEIVSKALKGKEPRAYSTEVYETLARRAETYKKGLEDDYEGEDLARERKKVDEFLRRTERVFKGERHSPNWALGDTFRIEFDKEHSLTGVLTGIKLPGEKVPGNPVAPSRIKLSMAVSSGIQSLDIALSSDLFWRIGKIGEGITPDWDNLLPTENREDRVLITGNLLEGYNAYGARAEMVSFTDDKGTRRDGILLPRKKTIEDIGSSVVSSEEAYEKMATRKAEGRNGAMHSSNEASDQVRVWWGAGEVNPRLIVPLPKNRGQKYWGDAELVELTVAQRFDKSRSSSPIEQNRMVAAITPDNLRAALAMLTRKHGLRWQSPAEIEDVVEASEVTLDSLGLQQTYEATARLAERLRKKHGPKATAPENVELRRRKKDLGLVRAYLQSPRLLPGKARYYVVHGKNTARKQDRLRSIAEDRMDDIFSELRSQELGPGGVVIDHTPEAVAEFASVLWSGDAEGKEFTRDELEDLLKGSPYKDQVIRAYEKQRKLHSQAWRLLSSHRAQYGATTGRLEGHIPHLFETWNVYEMEEPELPEGVELEEGETPALVEGKILATFRSLKEAAAFIEPIAKANPDQEYRVRPKLFRMPDTLLNKTVLKDVSYVKLAEELEKQAGMDAETAMAVRKEVSRRVNRHRFLGNLRFRSGQTGFRQDDMYDILRGYYNSVARYVALDDFKMRVVPKFERDFGAALGQADKATRDRTMAQEVQRYVQDVNGVPGQIEELLDASIKAAFGDVVRSDRPTIWMVNKALHFTGTLKLGLFNLSAGIVNLTQLTNTFAKLPTTHLAWALAEVVRPSAKSRAILRRVGVASDLGLANTGGYSVTHRGGTITRGGMVFFNTAERINRMVTALASYRHARKDLKLPEKQARAYARQMVDATQFDYSVADTPKIFRNPAGRFFGQFKPFAVKQLEFITGLEGAEHIKFWIPMLLMAGFMGIPLVEGLSELIEYLTGKNPIVETKRFLMTWAGGDRTKRFVARIGMHGILSALGIDISRRVGAGDFAPRRFRDLLGPTINTIMQAKTMIEKRDATEFARSLAPSVGNFVTALETAANGMDVQDPWHRDRLRYTATPGEVATKVIGLRPLRESELSDIAEVAKYERRKRTVLQQRIIDGIIRASKEGDVEAVEKLLLKAGEKGIDLTEEQLVNEVLAKSIPEAERRLLDTPYADMPDMLRMHEYVGEAASQ